MVSKLRETVWVLIYENPLCDKGYSYNLLYLLLYYLLIIVWFTLCFYYMWYTGACYAASQVYIPYLSYKCY